MTNDAARGRWMATAVWASVFVALTALIARETQPDRAAVLALAITMAAAAATHLTLALHERLSGPVRWAGVAAGLLLATMLGHAVLAGLGMSQSWGQDLLNLSLVSGVGLAIKLAWAGHRTRRVLEAEVSRREGVEARLQAAERKGQPIAVKVGHGRAMVDPGSVSLLEADGNFARLHAEGGPVFASESLKTLAERFAPHGFVRVHKSFVVNRAKVAGRDAEGVVLSDGRRVPLGRAFRTALD